ncbi:hypothetical protein F8388_017938 [Cannabis sativa]|uniref:Uncharacterized protein n=1 Tax=Cannabis sativa TaxID=3483 RepID=A0A7J6HGD8_CANSA|nr:hypothetical protein F8388_017938 [Cannabis sativa]
MAERDGVGLNKLQLTTNIPISLRLTFVLANNSSIAPNTTISTSSLAFPIVAIGKSSSAACDEEKAENYYTFKL